MGTWGPAELTLVIGAFGAMLLALVNRDRQVAGLPGLLWDEHVADVARGHSTEMRRTKIVAHLSPVTGSAADRVRAAKIKTAVVLENVARAYGLGEAHQGLMNSPGHRANLMSHAATHLGIGVRRFRFGQIEYCMACPSPRRYGTQLK